MRIIMLLVTVSLFSGCGYTEKRNYDEEYTVNANKSVLIFKNLLKLTNNAIPEEYRQDSLAFLILPVEASCPSCRKKTIDSIVKYKDQLLMKHYIIVSANAGRKTINSYFKEEGAEIPNIPDQLFLDSTNASRKSNLCSDRPIFYYTHNEKAYKQVGAIPATVKDNLNEFFSGR